MQSHVAVRALSSLHQETDADATQQLAGGTGIVRHPRSQFDCSLGSVLFHFNEVIDGSNPAYNLL